MFVFNNCFLLSENKITEFLTPTIKTQKHRTDRKQKTLTDERVVFQKNRLKMWTCLNHIEQYNDHTRIMRKIQFRNSFKCEESKKMIYRNYSNVSQKDF